MQGVRPETHGPQGGADIVSVQVDVRVVAIRDEVAVLALPGISAILKVSVRGDNGPVYCEEKGVEREARGSLVQSGEKITRSDAIVNGSLSSNKVAEMRHFPGVAVVARPFTVTLAEVACLLSASTPRW